MRIYDLPRSPWCQMVRIALADKNLPHERHIVLPGQESEDWFIGINPHESLPVLVDRDVVIRDPATINEYLEDAYPDRPLLPDSPPARARVRMMVTIAQELVGTPMDDYYQAIHIDQITAGESLDELRGEILDGLWTLEQELDSSSRFAVSEQFSLADAALAPFLIGLIQEAGLEPLLADLSALTSYRERLKRRPAASVVKSGWVEWKEMYASPHQ